MHKAAAQRRHKQGSGGGAALGGAGLAQASWWRELRAAMAVATLLGLAWIFGALVNTGDSNSSLLLQYLFAIFTTLQGFSIFLFYCIFNDKVWECIRRRVPASSSSDPRSKSKTKTGTTKVPTSGQSSSRAHTTNDSNNMGRSAMAAESEASHSSRPRSDTKNSERINVYIESSLDVSQANRDDDAGPSGSAPPTGSPPPARVSFGSMELGEMDPDLIL